MKHYFSKYLGIFFLFLMTHTGFAEDQDSTSLWMTVTGKANIERRNTIVPLALCQDLICPASKPYWVLTLHDQQMIYEVRQVYYLGSEQQPEFVELAGMIIRPGSRLSLDGLVDLLSEKYAIIRSIQGARLVMD